MNGDLTLSIRLLGQSQGRHQLALTVRNESGKRLLIPLPEITGFRFRVVGSAEEAEWGTFCLQTSRWKGVVLQPAQAEAFEFSAVACSARRRPTEEEIMTGRDERWCVQLRPGTYNVVYRLYVGDDYFDPDSHYRLPQVRRIAEADAAEVWMGEVVSNEVRIVHA